MQQGFEEIVQGTGIGLLGMDAPIHRLQDAGNLALLGERRERNREGRQP
jgi:hypothetical protein